MTRIAPDWLADPATRRVMAVLEPADPHFVGGCVRDALMGRETADIDISVRTKPHDTMALAQRAGLSAYPTGIDHGVVTITVDGAPFEVTTLRRDVATDGRRAVIAFANTLEEDAQRRDFTMNALYANGDGDVVDPTGEGVADLTARRIRFIGNAAGRIEEDYLRILRFFRFHAQFAITEFDQGALSACNTHASGLRHISRERILAEMLKLLRVANPEPTLAAMSGPLAVAMPGAKVFSGLVAVESALDLRPGELRRLAALGGAGGLPLSRAQKATLTAIKASCEMMGAGARLSAIAHAYGGDAVRDAVALFALSGGAVPPDWADQIALAQAAVMPITARDLIALGRHPGPALGAELKRLEAAWVASDFTLSAEQLLAGQP